MRAFRRVCSPTLVVSASLISVWINGGAERRKKVSFSASLFEKCFHPLFLFLANFTENPRNTLKVPNLGFYFTFRTFDRSVITRRPVGGDGVLCFCLWTSKGWLNWAFNWSCPDCRWIWIIVTMFKLQSNSSTVWQEKRDHDENVPSFCRLHTFSFHRRPCFFGCRLL